MLDLIVFYRSYSRNTSGKFEDWEAVSERALKGLFDLGQFSKESEDLIAAYVRQQHVLPSGRWLWCGGTEWVTKPENYYGAYNCTSNVLNHPQVFGWLMDLSMQGCGTGAVVEEQYISQLPPISTKLNVEVVGDFADKPGLENTTSSIPPEDYEEYDDYEEYSQVTITIGDSRHGWVSAYQTLINLAMKHFPDIQTLNVIVDVSQVRKEGQKLKGFGGTSNPIKLKELFPKIANILSGAYGRQLTAEECCLLCDEAALVVVAGNVRRSAAIKQFDYDAPLLKLGLWQCDSQGRWSIDPKKDALRMSNHTRVYHHKPTYEEVLDAVKSQYHSGEGAIQYANEAIARANTDLYNEVYPTKEDFLEALDCGTGEEFLEDLKVDDIDHRLKRYGLNPCGEIIGKNYFCNLSEIHLNTLDPLDLNSQAKAFTVGALAASALLKHKFENPLWRKSREIDPIVGVSFTGLFDFFVNLFGRDWLLWWAEGRPENFEGILDDRDKEILCTVEGYEEWMFGVNQILSDSMQNKAVFFKTVEQIYLTFWRELVEHVVGNYCKEKGLKIPNRSTTVQPAGTKSLLTNASPGWHPPKAIRFIRRVTFKKDDPVALAAHALGCSIIPGQSDKDENGNLLNDPYDSRCTSWLVEVPIKVDWADTADGIDISKFSATAQFDFYMQVQKYYTRHNTSATIELREPEIEPLAKAIHKAIKKDEGYISAALLGRFDANETFPRLPFEPISEEKYQSLKENMLRSKIYDDFLEALNFYSQGRITEVSPAGCDSDKCLIPETPKH